MNVNALMASVWSHCGSPVEVVEVVAPSVAPFHVSETIPLASAMQLVKLRGPQMLAVVASRTVDPQVQVWVAENIEVARMGQLLANEHLTEPAASVAAARLRSTSENIPPLAASSLLQMLARFDLDASWVAPEVTMSAFLLPPPFVNELSEAVKAAGVLAASAGLRTEPLVPELLRLLATPASTGGDGMQAGWHWLNHAANVGQLAWAFRPSMSEDSRSKVQAALADRGVFVPLSSRYASDLDGLLDILDESPSYAFSPLPTSSLFAFGWVAPPPSTEPVSPEVSDALLTRAAYAPWAVVTAAVLGLELDSSVVLPSSLIRALVEVPGRLSKAQVVDMLQRVTHSIPAIPGDLMVELIERWGLDGGDIPWENRMFRIPVHVPPSPLWSPLVVRAAVSVQHDPAEWWSTQELEEFEAHVAFCVASGDLSDVVYAASVNGLAMLMASTSAADATAHILFAALGSDVESWTVFGALLSSWLGPIGDLLTVCTTQGAAE